MCTGLQECKVKRVSDETNVLKGVTPPFMGIHAGDRGTLAHNKLLS